MLAIDGLQALYSKTEYRNQHYEHIKSYHLSLPRLLMEYASGKRIFVSYSEFLVFLIFSDNMKARGAVVGALAPSLSQYPIPPELKQALQLESPSPYTKLNPGMLEYAQGLEAMQVPESLEYSEATSIFEIWARDRALHTSKYFRLMN